MRYWVLENAANDYVQIHRGECDRCQNGQKPQPGTWTGFDSYDHAMEHCAATNRPVLQCTLCHPERYA
ncbi:MAG: hypothetical protein ACOC9B_02090 [Chloroflexota bacterium]